MSHRQTLYDSVRQQREVDRKIYQRIMITGYFNEQEVKHQNLNIQKHIRESLLSFRQVKSYIYIKGVFYIQILEAQNIAHINHYLKAFQAQLHKHPTLIHNNRIIHQSYENTTPFFKGVDCDNNPQPGPILTETQKTEEQIQDRSFEIYQLFIDGARMRSQNPSHRISNMIVLSNDDLSILNCDRFMSLKEYLQLYTGEMNVERQQDSNFPLPPSFFDVMEFFEIQQYQQFRAK